MFKSVNIHEAKTNLSQLIMSLEKQGGSITICRYGIPVANLVSLEKKKRMSRLRKHPILSKVKIIGDITRPLPPEDWGSLI